MEGRNDALYPSLVTGPRTLTCSLSLGHSQNGAWIFDTEWINYNVLLGISRETISSRDGKIAR